MGTTSMILTSLRRRVDALSDRVHGLLQEQENRKGAEDRFARQLCGDLTRLRVNYANALRSGHVSSQERLQFDAQHLAIQKDLLRILRGQQNPTIKTMERLARALGCHVTDLLDERE